MFGRTILISAELHDLLPADTHSLFRETGTCALKGVAADRMPFSPRSDGRKDGRTPRARDRLPGNTGARARAFRYRRNVCGRCGFRCAPVIRRRHDGVQGFMNEASEHLVAERSWAVPAGRRLGIVRDGENPSVPTPGDLIRCVAAVAAERDRAAFAALFRYFGPRLKTFFLRGALPAAVSEDLVQETMLAVWRKAQSFNPERAGVTTWVFTIARNLRIDHLRRQRNPADLPCEPEEEMRTVEALLLDGERDLRVRNALAGLSPEQQTIIRLSYYGEKSQSEIAGELGIPLGTVKSRTRLAMNRLRALLEDER
ncbi:sigma-70 family RNA polymerase sigma factor [Rhizobium sp. TRM95111]|uniref:sigma-70 family RNA polymerase sigma factor n=1 Tax=Rhizobium alarense TaxID=2846851 RepID=UPI001F2D37FF|nr:sigma-70 family RNA polymerase sigma factor [Rhizobium alarense]MCF3641869.1 sigma-70 family RNA polymerase sigma factor [Rhizobium alarense]